MLQIGKPETSAQLEEYFDLRWRILRAPWSQPRGSEKDELDLSSDHVTARDRNGRLLGIGRIHMNDEVEAQIRYMATEENCRWLGVGHAIIMRLEELAYMLGAERIILNARDNVIGFYEHHGYTVVGSGPTMFGVITHSRMEKRL